MRWSARRRSCARGCGLERRRGAVGRLRLASRAPSVPGAGLPARRASTPTRPRCRGPAAGRADAAHAAVAPAGSTTCPERSFDVVLYRLVLHHLAFHGAAGPRSSPRPRACSPAAGALIAIEPGLWHPVGLGLAAANRLGLGVAAHGTPDDVPLSPRLLMRAARDAGLQPELHGVTYGWRRMRRRPSASCRAVDRRGDRPDPARFAHTLLLIARRRRERPSGRPVAPDRRYIECHDHQPRHRRRRLPRIPPLR